VGRKKKAKVPAMVISSWQEADAALASLAGARQAQARIAAEAERQIAEVTTCATAAAAGHAENEKAILAGLEAFTKAHETELEGRSKRLPHGVVGLRKATKIALFRTVKFVLDALKAEGLTNCIRTKEEIDKEALDKFSEADLKTFGCRRNETDNFYVELDEVTVKT
jgi:phage host-nuclease inhibitor protein Gam